MNTLPVQTRETQDAMPHPLGRFQFSLRSMFIALTVCAVLAAAWPWQWSDEGQALLFVYLGLSAIQCGLVTWAIAAWRQQYANVAKISNDERQLFVGTLTLGMAIPVILMLAILSMIAGGRSFQPVLAICTGLLVAELWLIIPLVGSLLSVLKSHARIPLALLLVVNLVASIVQVFVMVLVTSVSC